MKSLLRLCMLLAGLLLALTAEAQQVTRLQGRVYLCDTLPAPYATIYLPDYGLGTVTDAEGNYVIDNVPASPSVTFEYSYLGYRTEQVKLNVAEPNHRYAHDQHLAEQAIELSEVYLTPGGEDPCLYILRRVHETALANRRRLQHYEAECSGSFHVQDLDIVVQILPDFARTMLNAMLRTVGFYALFSYLTGSEQADVAYRFTQTWDRGKAKNSPMAILSANPPMPDKAQKQMSKIQVDDFYSLLYGDSKKFDVAKETSRQWQLKGVIEENGHAIDVLTRSEGDSVVVNHTLYVIEDLWQILRYESRTSRGSVNRLECRDIGSGIYLPVLLVTNPIPIDFSLVMQQMRQEYEAARAKGESQRTEKKILERYERIMQHRSSASINLVTPFSVRYSGVHLSSSQVQ